MKDRDEIIKHLCFVHTWATVNPKYGMGLTIEECLSAEEWINDAIEFLRAQEPVKPDVKIAGCFKRYYCGACKVSIEPNHKFCRICGRAVKWDD